MLEELSGTVEISNDGYRAALGVSKSHINLIAKKSALHYWHRYLNADREPSPKTPEMLCGSTTYIAILQPRT